MIEVVKGGLILDLGVRGFLPASLVDIRRVQDLDEFLGQELRAKVIELNRSRNNVVLSRRAVLEDERKEMRQAILDRLNPGDVVDGQISNIVDFGAFVDLDGMDGLIHISELSWSHVNHPSEVLEIGQDVKVKVLDIDRERQRISLGLKQTQTDPWQQVLETYHEGDEVEGKVTKVVTFGAFVEIMPGVEGLVHISELAQHHVENPREVVSQGDLVSRPRSSRSTPSGAASRSRSSGSRAAACTERAEDAEAVEGTPNLDLSEEVFPEASGRSPRHAPRSRGSERRGPSRSPREAEPEAARGAFEARRRGGARAVAEEPLPRSPCRGAGRGARGRGARARAEPAAEEPEPAAEAERSRRRARVAWRDRSPSPSPAASEPARARPSPPSRVTAPPSISSDDIVHRLLQRGRGRARGAASSASATRSSTRTATSTAARSPRSSSPTARRSTGSRPAAPAGRARSTWAGASGWPSWTIRRAVSATEVPLLYEVGGQDRFDAVVVVTAPPEVRGARSEVAAEEREPRLLPDSVKVAQADFAYVNDGSLEKLDDFVQAVLRELTR